MIRTLHTVIHDLAHVQGRESVWAAILEGYRGAVTEAIQYQGFIEQTPLEQLSGPDLRGPRREIPGVA